MGDVVEGLAFVSPREALFKRPALECHQRWWQFLHTIVRILCDGFPKLVRDKVSARIQIHTSIGCSGMNVEWTRLSRSGCIFYVVEDLVFV